MMTILDLAPKKASFQRALATGRRPRGEESWDVGKKPLPGRWNEVTTLKAAGGGLVGSGNAE